MTSLDGTCTEPCGCALDRHGRPIRFCRDCAKAALEERTRGVLAEPSFFARLLDAMVRLPRCL